MNDNNINDMAPKLYIKGKEFSVSEIECCVGGNFIGRNVNRLILGIQKGVRINDKRINDLLSSFNNMDNETLNKINQSATKDSFKASIAKASLPKLAEMQQGKVALQKELGKDSPLLKNPERYDKVVGQLLSTQGAKLKTQDPKELKANAKTLEQMVLIKEGMSHVPKEPPSAPKLAKCGEELVWVVNNEGQWTEADPRQEKDPANRTVYEPNQLQFIDMSAHQLAFNDGQFSTEHAGTFSLPGMEKDYAKNLQTEAQKISQAIIDPDLAVSLDFSNMSAIDPIKKDLSFITDKSKKYVSNSSENNMQAEVRLQAKGYLPAKELIADWATIDHIGNLTLAIVADAAGNKEESHNGSVELVNLFRKNFMQELMNLQGTSLTMEDIGAALEQALVKTEAVTKMKDPIIRSTMACTVVVPVGTERYAIGFCLGDARVMSYNDETRQVNDLTPTPFNRPYEDSGSAFGGKINRVQPIFQKLGTGDVLMMGSDGFGDNVEAKTLKQSPWQVLRELYEAKELNGDEDEDLKGLAKKLFVEGDYYQSDSDEEDLVEEELPWIAHADASTYWTGDTKEAKKWQEQLDIKEQALLQKLHTRYAEHMVKSTIFFSSILDAGKNLHDLCTKSTRIQASLFALGIQKEIDKLDLKLNLSTRLFPTKEKFEEELTALIALNKLDQEDIDELKKQYTPSPKSVSQEEHYKELSRLIKENKIIENKLEEYKAHASSLMLEIPEEERKSLFKEWEKDPEKMHNWVLKHMAKPDDFSLVTLRMRST